MHAYWIIIQNHKSCNDHNLRDVECTFLYRSAQARAHASLGYVYELLQDTDKAIDHYEQVCLLDPCNANLLSIIDTPTNYKDLLHSRCVYADNIAASSY